MSSKDFERHENIHKGIKKHICPVCSKACSTKSELRRHVGFHGEKKFKCEFEGCSFACTDAIGLNHHIKLMHTHKNYKPYACPVCPYRTGVRGNVDKHIRTVHDLVVVTKHTVALKMKYPDFSSGDVITKNGDLVATAQERKSLQEAPHPDRDGNIMGALDSSIQTNLSELSGVKNSKGYQKYKHPKKINSSNSNPAAAGSSVASDDVYPSPQTDNVMSASVAVVTQPVTNASSSGGARDFAALSNYVYIHGDAVMTSLGVASGEAQDLRTPAGVVNATQPDQTAYYSLGHGDLFLTNKYDGYQDQ